MLPTLQARFDALEERRRALLDELRGGAPAQLRFRPSPDAWSPLAVAHHLVRVEQEVLRSLRDPAQAHPRSPGVRDRVGALVVWAVFRLGVRVRVPVRGVRPDPEPSLNQVERGWSETRPALRAYLAGVGEADRSAAVFRHPIGGPLTAEETLRFLTRHWDHHLRQLRRIRAAPGFPG